MGEMADEAMYQGWIEMSENYERSHGRTVCIGDPKYDPDYWRDVCGKVRKLTDMNTMHLALVFKQLEFNKGRFYNERKSYFKSELLRRGFDEQYWNDNLLGVALGLYCFYPEENDRDIEDYYRNMLRSHLYENKIIGYDYPDLKRIYFCWR